MVFDSLSSFPDLRCVALGVGAKALPGLSEAVETPDIATESHLSKMWEPSDGTLVSNGNGHGKEQRDLMASNSPSCTRTASSAMHSIMEQGMWSTPQRDT